MKHVLVLLSSLAATAALFSLSPIARAQSTCATPGFAVTPIIHAWTGRLPPEFTAMKRVADGSWTAAQLATNYSSNPLNIATVTPNFQNQVVACAPPGNGHTGSGTVTGVAPPAMSSQFAAIGDMDGSGNLSAALISGTGVTVYIGTGSFMMASSKSYPTGFLPTGVALADLNHDGKADLVVADLQVGQSSDNGDVAVLINNGDGSFQNPVKYSAGSGPISVAIADVDGDGIPDIVSANNNDGTVSVLSGKGDGTFKPAVNYPIGGFPQGLLLVDFNGDGKLDIAAGTAGSGVNTVSVLLNQGNGTFGAARNTPCPSANFFLTAYDFNSDGKQDVVVNDAFGTEIAVLLGKGDGTFTWSHTYAVAGSPTALIVTDFNNDGIADIMVASGNDAFLGPDTGSGNISVLLGNGDGTFRGTALYNAGSGAKAAAIADFNKDGDADVVVSSPFGNPAVQFFKGNGDGTFAAGTSIPQFSSANFVVTADFDGDGNPDIAVTGNGSVQVSRGDGHGGFAAPTSTSVSVAPQYLAVGDFNNDGKPDLLAAEATSTTAGAVSLLIGNGNGTFKTPTTPLSGVNAQTVATGDFNLDGNLDAVVAIGGDPVSFTPGSLVILKGTGTGTLTAQPALTVGGAQSNPISVAVGDVNSDGRPDLVVAYEDFDGGSNHLQIFLGNGDGTFRAQAPMDTDFGPVAIVISDFNGDGHPDLIVSHCCGATDMTYLLGVGDGTFQAETHFSGGPSPYGLAMGELNGDGVQDLVVTTYEFNNRGYMAAVPGAGLRTQSAASFAFMPLAPDSIVASFGAGIATGTLPNVTATSLLGTTIDVKDSAGVTRPATLTFIDPHQVNYIIPDGTASGLATITVHSGTGTDLTTQYYVAGNSPGIFVLNGAGLIAADVLRVHSDGTSVGENIYNVVNNQLVPNPVNLGVAAGDTVFLEIFGTGFRFAGQSNVQVTIGGVNAPVSFAGAQVSPGLDQLNVQVPTSLAGRGKVTVVVTVNGNQVANLTNFVIQ